MIDVSDQHILDAMHIMGKHEGIFGEPAAAAACAGLIKARHLNIIKPHETVTIINTGNGLKDPKHAVSATQEPTLMKPDIDILIKYLEQEGEQ
jgi:threonine synthase